MVLQPKVAILRTRIPPGDGEDREPLPDQVLDQRAIRRKVFTAREGISSEMIRDLMLECVERRFDALRVPQPVRWLADNGSTYTAAKTLDFATALNLVPRFTPVRNLASNSVCEAFVKIIKRDYVRVNPRQDAISLLQQLPAWFEDYNTIRPYSGLRMQALREFIAQQPATPAECPV